MLLKFYILSLVVAIVPQTETQPLNKQLPHIAPQTFRSDEYPHHAFPSVESVQQFETSGSPEEFKAFGFENKTRRKRGIGGLHYNGNKPSFQSSPTSAVVPWGRPGRISSNGNKPPLAGKPRDPNFQSLGLDEVQSQQSISNSQVDFASQSTSFSGNELASRPATKPLKFVALAVTALAAASAIRSAQKGNDETNPIQNHSFSKKSLFGENNLPLAFSQNLSPTNFQRGSFGLQGQTEFGVKPTLGKQINTWENDDCYFCTTTKLSGGTTDQTKKTEVVRSNLGANEDITDMFRHHISSPNGQGKKLSAAAPMKLNDMTSASSFQTFSIASTSVRPLLFQTNWLATRLNSITN